MRILDQQQIKELINKPENLASIAEAKKDQAYYKQFYNNENPEVITNRAKELLNADDFILFKSLFKNPVRPLINKVETHFKKIYGSDNRIIKSSFGDDKKASEDFTKLRKKLYHGLPDIDYWRRFAHKLIFTEPSSLFLTAFDGIALTTAHMPLSKVHSISANEMGVEYVIFKEEKEGQVYYYCYDSLYYSIYKETEQGIILDTTVLDGGVIVDKTGFHGANKCPVTRVYEEVKSVGDNIVMKNPLTDYIDEICTYSIFKTIYDEYKYFSGFGNEVRAETNCMGFNDGSYTCNGEFMFPNGKPNESTKCTACTQKKKTVGGERITIPRNQQSEEFLKNVKSMYFRVEADSNILTFHSSDIKSFKYSVLEDIIGEGYGSSRDQQVNKTATETKLTFDDQESNLYGFKEPVERSWSNTLDISGSMLSVSYEYSVVSLTDKWYLQSINGLQEEYSQLRNVTSSQVLLQAKEDEIVRATYKNNDTFMKRHHIIKALQPFSGLTEEYINTNYLSLSQSNPNAMILRDNFTQVLAIFEAEDGDIEDYFTDSNYSIMLKNIKIKFLNILNDLGYGEGDRAGETPRSEERADTEKVNSKEA